MNSKFYKFLSYLEKYNDNYVLIGGNACSIYLEERKILPRKTVDFDIVLCYQENNIKFEKTLIKVIEDGNYESKFKNGKLTAYRFEHPKTPDFPSIIELFCSINRGSLSKNKRFTKLNLVVNEEKASAMTITVEIFEYLVSNKITKDGLPIPNIYSLIVLKVYGYFENLRLYKEKQVHRNDVNKHRTDVILLLLSMQSNEIIPHRDYPLSLSEYMNEFINVLSKASDVLKNRKITSVKISDIVEKYKKIFIQ